MLARVLCCSVFLSLFLVAADIATDPPVCDPLNPCALAPDPTKLHPVERVPRARYGRVGAFPLDEKDLRVLVYPSATPEERAALLEGLAFFTTPHTEPEGLGPVANQKFCLGCHTNSDDVLHRERNHLVHAISQVSRAARSSTTNFSFTSFNPDTGGGRAPDNVEAINNTGKTAAFTLFGDFNSATHKFVVPPPKQNPAFGAFTTGGVQRVRPSLDACLPDRIPLSSEDPLLTGPATGFRRTTGERAAPPYIGRGLIEAVFDGDIVANVAEEKAPIKTSLRGGNLAECAGGDCVAGRANMNSSNQAFTGGHTDRRVGRLGLRAAGPTLTQFMIGGSQGELGFTSPLLSTEPKSFTNFGRAGCVNTVPSPEIPTSTILSLRSLIRLTAPPEFGQALLNLLHSPDPGEPPPDGTIERRVKRGAELFGVDLRAFADRMVPGLMPAGGDGRDDHAINQADRKLNCVGCHTPVMRTGQLQPPPEVGAELVENAWIPLFSDELIHKMTNIDAERNAPTQRLPLLIQRVDSKGRLADTLDLARGLTDDTLPNQGLAGGDEWRTPPLMGLGKIGPPFLHDARVYLSQESVATTPAGTVYTDAGTTNSPLVVRTLADAIRAAIELHDLPAPFNAPNQSTETGGGCPVPPGNSIGDVHYEHGAADICPPYQSSTSVQNRSQARNVIKRWHSLSESDQRAVVEFLKQL